MMKRYPLLVFDWDGTLMDSPALIVSSIERSCLDLGLPVPPERESRYIIGLGFKDSLLHLVPTLAEEDYPQFTERYRYHFLSRDHESPLFSGVESMLEELGNAGHSLAVATGKSRVGLQRSLQQTDLGKHFQATRCADQSFPKPHPAMLLEVMDTLGMSADQTLMIGDTSHDLSMAQSAGVSAIAITHGAHTADELEALKPLACVDSIAALRTWLTLNG